MRRSVYKFSEEKLDPICACPTCARSSRAYLHHLTKAGETLGWQLLGKHNLHFYHQLMREIRQSILADCFLDLYREKRAFLHESDMDNPIRAQKAKRKMMPTLGNYEVHKAWEGFASIRQISSGEIMHTRTAPMEEAKELYIEQSNLAERVQLSASENPEHAAPLVIWDVGLGAAANAMARLPLRGTGGCRSVRPLHRQLRND
jgi:queuine tRNA-ribosyltransferase